MNRGSAIQLTYFSLRVVAGWLIFQAGTSATFGWWGIMPPGTELDAQMTIGKWMETIGGLLIMLGLLTRPVAVVLAGEMAVAYWQFHYGKGDWPWTQPWTWPAQNDGTPAVTLCFIFLFMAAYGGGKWSLDWSIWGRADEPLPAAGVNQGP